MNISGTWVGEYVYDESEATQVGGQVVAFTMVLKQGWFGMVSGTVQDDARSGFAEAGEIKGRIKGETCGFNKLQPKMRLMHERSRMTLEQVADRYNVVINTKKAHPAILHMGKVSADGKEMEGKWRVPEAVVEVPGSASSVSTPVMTGTWKARRKE